MNRLINFSNRMFITEIFLEKVKTTKTIIRLIKDVTREDGKYFIFKNSAGKVEKAMTPKERGNINANSSSSSSERKQARIHPNSKLIIKIRNKDKNELSRIIN
ncbi:MAG: hypothetical protein ACE5HI_08965 [bacterium]